MKEDIFLKILYALILIPSIVLFLWAFVAVLAIENHWGI